MQTRVSHLVQMSLQSAYCGNHRLRLPCFIENAPNDCIDLSFSMTQN